MYVRNRKHEGLAILEAAMVIFFLLTFLVGASDIMRIFQTRTALQESVRTASRCMYVTDGCVTAGKDTRVPYFNVYSTGQLFNYYGKESWYEIPQIRFDHPAATILQNVYYTIPRRSWIARKEMYRLAPTAQYWRRTFWLPTIELPGGIGRNFALRGPDGAVEQFTSKESAAARTISATSRRTTQYTYTFRIAPKVNENAPKTGNYPCYATGPHGATDFTTTCEESSRFPHSERTREQTVRDGDEAIGHTYVVLYVRGTELVSGAAAGSVAIELTGPGVVETDLGGAQIDAGSGGNFVPRGAPTDHYVGEIAYKPDNREGDPHKPYPNTYHLEEERYSRIRLRYNTDYKLTFTVSLARGQEVQWRFDGLDVWYPTYTFVSTAPACIAEVPRSQRNSSPPCPPYPARALTYRAELVRIEDTPLGCTVKKEEAQQAFRTYGAADYDLLDNGDCSSSESMECTNIQGAAANYGVPEIAENYPAPDGPPRIRNSEAAHAICPVQDARLGGEAPLDVSWSEVQVDLPQQAFTVQPADCAPFVALDTYLPEKGQLPGELLKYPKHDTGRGAVDNSNFIRATGPFSCVPPIRYMERIYTLAELPANSLFQQTNLGDTWQDRLAAEAQRLGLVRQGATFTPLQSAIHQSGRSVGRQFLGRFAKGVVPEDCKLEGVVCTYEIAGYQGSITAAGVDKDKALQLAYDQLDHTAPRLVHGCEGLDCVRVVPRVDESTHQVDVEARATIPIFLGMKSVTLSARASERQERSFVQ